MVIIMMASSENIPIVSFRIVFLLMNCRQWVVDVILVQTPSRLQL